MIDVIEYYIDIKYNHLYLGGEYTGHCRTTINVIIENVSRFVRDIEYLI